MGKTSIALLAQATVGMLALSACTRARDSRVRASGEERSGEHAVMAFATIAFGGEGSFRPVVHVAVANVGKRPIRLQGQPGAGITVYYFDYSSFSRSEEEDEKAAVAGRDRAGEDKEERVSVRVRGPRICPTLFAAYSWSAHPGDLVAFGKADRLLPGNCAVFEWQTSAPSDWPTPDQIDVDVDVCWASEDGSEHKKTFDFSFSPPGVDSSEVDRILKAIRDPESGEHP